MRIDVTGTGLVITRVLRLQVRRRVLLSMSRFGPEVQGVTARLAESHTPLGGVDQRCRLRARLRSGQVLRAEAVNGFLATAIGRSVARLGRLVGATLDGGDGRLATAPALRHRRSDE